MKQMGEMFITFFVIIEHLITVYAFPFSFQIKIGQKDYLVAFGGVFGTTVRKKNLKKYSMFGRKIET